MARTLVVTLLNSLGYQIMVGGAAALEHLGSTTRVNLLLTAVVLASGMNGRELAAEVGSPLWNIRRMPKNLLRAVATRMVGSRN